MTEPPPEVTGVSDGALGAFTAETSGTSMSGDLAASLGTFTAQGAGTFTTLGTLTPSLGAFTGTGTGNNPAGPLAGSLGAFTATMFADLLNGGTDTVNYSNGRARLGSGDNQSAQAFLPLPPGLVTAPHRVMAQKMPAPVLVKGRPT